MAHKIEKENRKRNNKLTIYFSDDEISILEEKLKLSSYSNMSQLIRNLSINGYIIINKKIEVKELAKEINFIGRNINQITKKFNSEGHISKTEIQDIKDKLDEIWNIISKLI